MGTGRRLPQMISASDSPDPSLHACWPWHPLAHSCSEMSNRFSWPASLLAPAFGLLAWLPAMLGPRLPVGAGPHPDGSMIKRFHGNIWERKFLVGTIIRGAKNAVTLSSPAATVILRALVLLRILMLSACPVVGLCCPMNKINAWSSGPT